MKLTNTYISKDCTRKVLMYVDDNGHYEIIKKVLQQDGWERVGYRKFKHIESAQRAVNKFIQ
jgi:hypothetical protein